MQKLVVLLLAAMVAPLHASENAVSLRSCPQPPDPAAPLAVHASTIGDVLGCYRRDVQDSGWQGLIFDRGVVAESTGSTIVRLTSYSSRELVVVVISSVGPIEGQGSMSDFAVDVQGARGTAAPGQPAAFPPPSGQRADLEAGVSLQYTLPDDDTTYRLQLPPITLTYTPYQLDLGTTVDATDATSLAAWKGVNRGRILRYVACQRKRHIPFTLEKQGPEDFGSAVLAALAVAREERGYRCPTDVLTGEQRPLLELVDEAIRQSYPASLVGTTIDDLKAACPRDGEYDSGLWAFVRAAAEYGDLINPATLDHVFNDLLAPYSGRYVVDASFSKGGFCDMSVPESENHILLIETSRYLINDLLQRRLGAAASPSIDNGSNGQRQWMLDHLNLLATGGFYEYNAIPYQRYSFYALSNLADLCAAGDPVKEAARLLIRVLDTKFVFGTVGLRRNAPLRRRTDASIGSSQTFFSNHDDVQSSRWSYFIGRSVGLDDSALPDAEYDAGNRDFRAMHWWQTQNVAIAALTAQQPSTFLSSLVWERSAHPWFQAYANQGPGVANHLAYDKSGYEIYWNDRNFMLAAGGERVAHGYDVDKFPPTGGFSIRLATALAAEALVGVPLIAPTLLALYPSLRDAFAMKAAVKENQGTARPTLVLPVGSASKRSDMLRFDGHPSSPHNSCVAPNFACGTRPGVPNIFSTTESCDRYVLKDAYLEKFRRSDPDVLGCPLFGTEKGNRGDRWVTFANGAAAVRYDAAGNLAYELTAKVRYLPDDKYVVDLTFFGPARDFHIVRYTAPGASKPTQVDLGRNRGYQVSNLSHQITVTPGRYSIQMEGCYFGTVSSSCPDGWIATLDFEVRTSPRLFPAPSVCSASIPDGQPRNGNVATVMFGTPSQDGCKQTIIAGIFVSPCEMRGPSPDAPNCDEAGGNYGFAEVVSGTGRAEELEAFQRDFAGRVASRSFRFGDTTQNHTLQDGSTVGFVFHPSQSMTWAIRSYSSNAVGASVAATLGTDIRGWPRATGEYMKEVGAVYTIRQPSSGLTWVLDASDSQAPQTPPD